MSHVYAHPEAEVAHVAAPQLQRACACGESAGVSGKCPECAARDQLGVQPKLSLNRPGDRYEQEADRIADRIVAAREPGTAARTSPLQRQPQGAEEDDEELQAKAEGLQRQPEEEEDEKEIQAKSAGGPVAGAAVGHAAAAVAGGGRPLSGGERSWFEPRLGRDLAPVRIHEDTQAGTAARGIHARAYTLRNHIAFAPGAYDDRSTEGRRLLAHELVHTIQQSGFRSSGSRAVDEGSQPSVTAAPARALQRRLWGSCPPGRRIGARPPHWTAAELRAVAHYKATKSGHTVVSNLDNLEQINPRNAYEKQVLPVFVRHFRGRSALLRPDIWDLTSGEIYDVKARRQARKGIRQIRQYIRLLQTIETSEALPPNQWRHGTSLTPIAPLSLTVRPLDDIVCYGVTNFDRWEGIIKYMVIDPKKKDKKKKKKKKADGKKKAKAKAPAKSAKRTAGKSAKKALGKGALKKGGTQVVKGVGKKAALKGAAKKLIPGATWIEAATVAAALAAGAKPVFGGEGMSAEEALVEIAKTGRPPDVKISDELQQLLMENPDVLERLRAATGDETMSDEAAQEMIDMLEANKDLLDAETLEKIATLAEASADPQLAKTAEEFRKSLEAIRAGKTPKGGAGEPEAEEKEETEEGTEAEEETEAEGEAETAAEQGAERKAAKTGLKLPEEFKKDLQAKKPLSELFDEVLDRTKKEGFDEQDLERFRKAVAGLTEAQIKQILDELAKLPPVEAEAKEPKQKVLDVVVELAGKITAGEKAPPEPKEGEETEPAAGAEAAGPAAGGGPIVLDERKLKWIRGLMKKLKPREGPRARVEIALSRETVHESVFAMHEKVRTAKAGEKPDLGTLPAAFAVLPQQKGIPTLGSFVTLSVVSLVGTKLTVQVAASSQLVDNSGKTVEGPSPVGTKLIVNVPAEFLKKPGGTK